MNPTALRLRGYRTFESLDVELPSGTVALIGTNGAGKSSIVNAIDLALFGPESRSWAPYLTVGAESTELMVELEFEHADHSYRVRRGYSARGAGKSTVDLEEGDGGLSEHDGRWIPNSDWRPLTLGSAKETQARLEQILGFSRNTLRASSLLLQGQGDVFTAADPRDRKRILADTLGLDRFDVLLAAVRRDRRAADQEIQRIDGRLQGVTAEQLAAEGARIHSLIHSLNEREAEASAALATAETALEEAAAAWFAEQTRAAERQAAVSRLDAAAAAHTARAQLREQALQAALAVAEIKEELDALPMLLTREVEAREQFLAAAVQQHKDALRERDEARRLRELREAEKSTIAAQAMSAYDEAQGLNRKIAHLETGELDACPTCKQALDEQARLETISSLRAQEQEADEQSDAPFERAYAIVLPNVPDEPKPLLLDGELETVRRQIHTAREADLSRARLNERLATHTSTISAASDPAYLAELGRLAEERWSAEEALTAFSAGAGAAALQAAETSALSAVALHRTRLHDTQRDKAVEQERFAQHHAREDQVAADLAERERRQSEIDLLAILERAYGPDGIPALICENAAIPAIEVEANRILVELGGTTAGCRIELRTDRAKADGGVRDDVLDVVVVTEQGERAYETFSGGERTRLNLALRIALARLLATRRGAESRILCIDEPEHLDSDGTEALVEVLRALEQQSVFDRIFLVSHHAALQDAFDQTLTVVKEDGRSRVIGADVLEEAAA